MGFLTTRRSVIRAVAAVAATNLVSATDTLAAWSDFPSSPAPSPLHLWYRQPASQWIEALPVGNGRLGAMVFGGISTERIGLNEDTLWSGGPYDPAIDVPPETLTTVRQLIFAGKQKEAQSLADRTMMGNPRYQSSYQTIGELQLDFSGLGEVVDYRRKLDLNTAVARVEFTSGGVRFSREVFASPLSNCIVVRLVGDKPGQITLSAHFNSPQTSHTVVESPDTLRLVGTNGPMKKDAKSLHPADLRFESWARAVARGGITSAADGRLLITHADEVTLLIVAATSYRTFNDVGGDPAHVCRDTLQRASLQKFSKLKREHIAEHKRIFDRVTLSFAGSNRDTVPTDERLRGFTLAGDPQLAALYFQFGRYLLLSSSRKGGQPANLQGIWNKDQSAAWGGKYTVNINTEMNYWPCYSTNMAECDDPLLAMVEDLSKTGAVTAYKMYRAGGWVCHHNTDLWRATAPIDSAYYGLWPMGGAWLCNQLFERYRFTLDRIWLAHAYPLMKGSAQFFLDTLVKDPASGYSVTCPSMSPEHEWEKGVSLCAGPAMDMQILRQLFSNCMQAAKVLATDEELAEKWQTASSSLAQSKIGNEGQLQEWQEDLDASVPEVNHRHMSPLYAVFPGGEINRSTPDLQKAARKLMEMRTDTNTMGWAMAWRANLWARLGDAGRVGEALESLIRHHTEVNMFDTPSVQLDGNFGGTSAISEMLLQSHSGELEILPALPSSLPEGEVEGLLGRGGCEVGLQWRLGTLQRIKVQSKTGGRFTIVYRDARRTLDLRPAIVVELDGQLQTRA